MGYDLIIQASPAAPHSRAQAAAITREISEQPIIAKNCEIGAGPSAANAIDVFTLDECIAEGEFSHEEFLAFCSASGMPSNSRNAESAALFLDSKWGAVLAFVKLPPLESDVIAVFASLIAFAKERQCRVVDPQVGRDVDLKTPGRLPAMWK